MNTRTAKGFILTNPDTDGLSGEGERERKRDASFISVTHYTRVTHRNLVKPVPHAGSYGTDYLPLCVCTALNMPRLVVIFTSFNTFRLILKERSEMFQRDGHLGVGDVRETRDVVH